MFNIILFIEKKGDKLLMQKKKVTIQDIANELGISRNTVSKALNNTGILAESTKNKILDKAAKMGYKQFAYINNNVSNVNMNKEIALFTCSMPNRSHFGFHLLSGFEKDISSLGYKLSIYLIRDSELKSCSLPLNFNDETTDGIICIEMFDNDYSKMLSSLGMPTLFIDSPVLNDSESVQGDILLMENYHSVYKLTETLIKNNKNKIGFVGDNYHCQSFFERWKAYRDALLDNGLYRDDKYSVLEKDKSPYHDSAWLGNKIKELPELPDAFICANDFIAINLIAALKSINISVPNDVLVCGFDNSTESKIIEPNLTTVNIPSFEMGNTAADLLLSRINNHDIPFRTVNMRTAVIFRDSTGNNLIK